MSEKVQSSAKTNHLLASPPSNFHAFKNFCHKNLYNADVMSDISFQNNKLLNIFLVVIKITEFEQVEKADMTSAHLLIQSEKLGHAVDEFPK